MINVSEIFTTKPENYKTPVQKAAYETLEKLSIPFGRVDCDEAITMDDCLAIDEALKVKVVKTLLLCNRQQTAFYLFITPGDKHFSTKDFSSALGISRVSFAPSEQLGEKLGVTVGATTIFGMLNGSAKDVKVVFDRRGFIGRIYRSFRRHHHRLSQNAHPRFNRRFSPRNLRTVRNDFLELKSKRSRVCDKTKLFSL